MEDAQRTAMVEETEQLLSISEYFAANGLRSSAGREKTRHIVAGEAAVDHFKPGLEQER